MAQSLSVLFSTVTITLALLSKIIGDIGVSGVLATRDEVMANAGLDTLAER